VNRRNLGRFRPTAANSGFERRLLQHAISTFLILLGLDALVLYVRNGHVFSTEYLLEGYLTLSVVLVAAAVWHLRAYGPALKSSHLGMMTGMTLGMQTGMMVGVVLGATEGFLIGAVVTMTVASTLGAIAGLCAGVAGVLEGLMAGSMGGIMGAMTGVMLGEDVLWFMPPFMVLNCVIMFGLVYMVFKEVTSTGHEAAMVPSPRFLPFLLLNFTALVLLTLVVNLAPEVGHGGMAH
jgi:hypothetical protein